MAESSRIEYKRELSDSLEISSSGCPMVWRLMTSLAAIPLAETMKKV